MFLEQFANIQSSQVSFDWISILPPIITSVTTLIFGALLAGLSYLLRTEREHTKEMEQQLSERKRDTYMELMDIFEALLHGDEVQRKKNIPIFNEVSRKLLFYGSDNVIETYQAYLRHSTSEEAHQDLEKLDEETKNSLESKMEMLISNVLLSIRQDMGNKKTKIKGKNLFYQFDFVVTKVGEDTKEKP